MTEWIFDAWAFMTQPGPIGFICQILLGVLVMVGLLLYSVHYEKRMDRER